jgi:deoxyxylulose-5-phosphate synthase
MLYLTTKDLAKANIEALVVPVCEDHEIHTGRVLITLSKEAKKLAEFKGESADDITLYHPRTVNARRVIFLGLGKREEIKIDALRRLAGKAVKKCIKKGLKEVLFAVPSAGRIKLDTAAVLEAAGSCGAVLTAEEHSIIGGLGGAVAETLAEAGLGIKFKRLGVPDIYSAIGYPEDLYARYGIDKNGIKESVKKNLE